MLVYCVQKSELIEHCFVQRECFPFQHSTYLIRAIQLNILSTYFFDLKSFSFGVQSSRKLNSTSKKSGLVIIISIRLGGTVYAGFLMCK